MVCREGARVFSLGADDMSATPAKHLWKRRRVRQALVALGILVAITAAGLAKTSPIHTTVDHARSRATANLTAVDALTIAPIADRTSTVGIAAVPITPTVTFAQPTRGSVVTWSASGLPPGISISSSSGQLTGSPTTTGTYTVTVSATADTHPPSTASQSFRWLVDNTAPEVTRVTPDTGAGGTRTVIRGTGLRSVISVHFGSTPAAFTVNRRGTAIVTSAPAERPGVVDVTVTYAGGTRSPVATDRFTYVAPAISAAYPDRGPVTGGTRVRITGTGLAGATSVRFGNVPSRTFAVHHSQNVLTAIAPPGAAGTVPIVIVTPTGIVSTSGNSGFTYQAHA